MKAAETLKVKQDPEKNNTTFVLPKGSTIVVGNEKVVTVGSVPVRLDNKIVPDEGVVDLFLSVPENSVALIAEEKAEKPAPAKASKKKK